MEQPSTRVFYYAYFGGIPKYFSTFDPVTESASSSKRTSWSSGSGDFSWHKLLRQDSIQPYQTSINRSSGISSSGTTSIELLDDWALTITSLFAFYKSTTKRMVLQSNIHVLNTSGLTSVAVISNDTLSGHALQVLYIGNETIKGDPNSVNPTSIDIATAGSRALYGSDPAMYDVTTLDDGTIIGPEITTAPETWANRKLFVYMDTIDQNGDPYGSAPASAYSKLIFQGFINSIEPKSGGTVWTISARDTMSLLDRQVCSNLKTLTIDTESTVLAENTKELINARYVAADWAYSLGNTSYSSAVGPEIVAPGDPPTSFSSTAAYEHAIANDITAGKIDIVQRLFSSLNTFNAAALGRHGSILLTARQSDTAYDSNSINETGGPLRDGDGDFLEIYGAQGTKYNALITDAPKWMGISGETASRDEENLWHNGAFNPSNEDSPQAITVNGILSRFPIFRSHHPTEDGIVYVESEAIATSSAPTGSNDRADDYILVNEDHIRKINSSDSYQGKYFNKYANAIVYKDGREKSHSDESFISTAETGKSLRAQQICWFRNTDSGVALAILATSMRGDGKNGSYDDLAAGVGAGILDAYFDEANITRYLGRGITNSREYLISEPTPLQELLSEECKISGAYIYLKDDFTISAKPLAIDRSAASSFFSISHPNIVELPTISINLDGIINQVKFKTKYNFKSKEFEDEIVVNDLVSQKRFGVIKSIDIKNRGVRIPEGRTEKDYVTELAGPFLAQFQDPKPYINVTCNRTAFKVKLGDVVKFTHQALPNYRSGARGFTDEYCVVVGLKRDYAKMTVTFTLACDDYRQFKRGIIVPNMSVSTYDNGTGATVVSANAFTSSADGTTDIAHYANGMAVKVFDVSAGTYTATQTISNYNSGANSFTIGAGLSLASGDIVTFAEYDDGSTTATQKLYAFAADNATNKINTSDDPFRYV